MNLDSVVVSVQVDGAWSLVLTPARQQLPSKDNGNAPAQTAGWVRTSALIADHALPQHVVVSVSKQTLSIVDAAGTVNASYPAGVGTSTAPTPTGVIGYLQARYLDPSQNEAVHPIQLTSLHSSAADEPYLGHDGGLIGVHYNATSTGNVSHGCVRLAVTAINAVNALPLGTLITLVP
jgi:lipoprotein-anchoring transpeptidase ErfK/SrfK